jgi:hypothetical protein
MTVLGVFNSAKEWDAPPPGLQRACLNVEGFPPTADLPWIFVILAAAATPGTPSKSVSVEAVFSFDSARACSDALQHDGFRRLREGMAKLDRIGGGEALCLSHEMEALQFSKRRHIKAKSVAETSEKKDGTHR